MLGLLLCLRVGRKAEIVSRPPQSPGGETKAQRGAVPALEPCQVIVTHLLLELLNLDPEGWVGSVSVAWWNIPASRRHGGEPQ